MHGLTVLTFFLAAVIGSSHCQQDPFTPFYGKVWVTDSASLRMCRTGCGPICCPLNASLSQLGSNGVIVLTVNLDPQSMNKCNTSSFVANCPMNFVSNTSTTLTASSVFVGTRFVAYYQYDTGVIDYSLPVPGGSGFCNFTTSISDLLGNNPSTSSLNSGGAGEIVATSFSLLVLIHMILMFV